MQGSQNGTHPHTSQTTPPDTDECQYSDAYRAIKAGLDAWEMWQELDAPGRLAVILTHYTAAQWLEPEELQILACFRHMPPGKWAQIKLRYKEIGGSPHDLQCAVDLLLKVQPLQFAPVSAPAVAFQPIPATELYAKDLPPLGYIVEDILPIGATLFVGRAKDGKSLAMWNLSVAVAEGGLAFGRYRATAGEVLYLALEDGERRAKQRLTDQMRAMGMTTPPSRLSLVLWEAPRLGEGLEEALTQWLDEHREARLIVIDILEKVRPRRARNASVYQEDYLAVAPLQRLAQERGIAIVLVHHANKGKAEDFRDAVSGAMSLAGAADTLWVLKRLAGETDAALRITGRDVETQELALHFRDGFWTALGDREMVTMSQERQEILDVLRGSPRPLTPTQVAERTGKHRVTTTRLLRMLLDTGLVFQPTEGHYALSPTATDRMNPMNSVNSVNSVNAPVPPQAESRAMHAEFTPSPSCHESSQPIADTRPGDDGDGGVHGVHGVDAVQVTPESTGDTTTATGQTPPETPPGHGPSLTASVLWCHLCGQARPVALVGREYRCERCGSVLGVRTATAPDQTPDTTPPEEQEAGRGADARCREGQSKPQIADHLRDGESQACQEPSLRCVVCGDGKRRDGLLPCQGWLCADFPAEAPLRP